MQQPTNIPILDLRLQEFYQMIGQCIKAWAMIEDKLFDICELTLKTDRHLVSLVFFRQPTISARTDLTTNELLAALPQDDRGQPKKDPVVIQEWTRIRSSFTALFSERNSLAHDPVKMVIFGSPTAPLSTADGRTLSSTHSFETSTSAKEALRGKETRRVADIDLQQHLSKVNQIAGELEKFISGALTPAWVD